LTDRNGELGDAPSVGALLERAVARWGARIALRRRREPLKWSVLSWTELGQQVRAIAGGLVDLGVEAGDRVALLSTTRLEWTLIDYAVLSIGAVTVPLYHSNTADQVAWVLRHSGAKVAIVEDAAQLEKVQRAMPHLPNLGRVVVMEVMDLRLHDRAMLCDELKRDGRRLTREQAGVLQARRGAVEPHWLATIVYTSGTTGVPKGVRLTHRNLLGAVSALHGLLDVGTDDTTVLCLPLSHIYGRLGQYAALTHGFCIAYAARVDQLQDVLVEVRPTFFFGVPRIYERIYQMVISRYRQLPRLVRGLVRRGVEAERLRNGEAPVRPAEAQGRLLSAVRRVAPGRRLVGMAGEQLARNALFEPLRQGLGGRIRFCISGGAPLNEDVASFFRMAGIEILEGYGLTETVGATTLNPLGENRLGTVGRPLSGIRIRIAPDGEVLISGEMVFEGYHDAPEDTAEALTGEGWLHTGDVGRFDEAGFLVITDRKKDLLITSGAKNVAPQQVEAALRRSPYIDDALVFGDRRPYLVALVSLSRSDVERFAASVDLDPADWEAVVRDPRILSLVETEVEQCNARLARFERVRRFSVLPRKLTVEGGELTPTLKVRRSVMAERYRGVIEGMYRDEPV